MSNYPYFFTWTKQNEACPLNIDGVLDYHFLDQSNDQNKVLDFSSVSFQASFGLRNQTIVEAITRQLQSFAITSPKHVHTLKDETSQELLATLALTGKVFYTVSGAESIENALKMARQITQKPKVLARKQSYHGATLGALSITGDWRNNDHETIDQWTVRIPDHLEDPDGSVLEDIIQKEDPSTICAFCLETMSGVNGVHKPTALWYQKVQNICDQYGILLILDEVICGFARTGKYYGFQHYPFLKPDFLCFSKGITGGFIPFGAVYVKDIHAHYYNDKTLSCGLTNYAHPLGLAALAGVQNILKTKTFWQHLNQVINELSLFKKRNENKVDEIRHYGAMMLIKCNHKKTFLDFYQRGLYLICKPEAIIIAPALNMPLDDLQTGLQMIEEEL